MYKYCRIFCGLIFICCGLGTHCFANLPLEKECSELHYYDDFYVQPGGVYISPTEMFVLFEDKLFLVGALLSNEKGIYVPHEEMSLRLAFCPNCRSWWDPEKTHACKKES